MNIEEILIDSMKKYENGEENINDGEYDALEDYAVKKNIQVPKFGGKTNEVKLPYMMASLDKAKGKDAEKVLNKFMENNKGEYIILDKLDGVAALIIFNNYDVKIYGRGDGCYGQDLTFLKNYITLPKIKGYFAVKGELIITKDDFSLAKKELNNQKAKNNRPRNFLTGLLARKEMLNVLRYISFYAFDIINNIDDIDNIPSDDIQGLYYLDFLTPAVKIMNNLDVNILTQYLTDRKVNIPYEIDGLVIRLNKKSNENTRQCSSSIEVKNPKDQIAFKVDTFAVTKVIDIVWEMNSRYGRLFPVVYIEPVFLLNTDTKKITGKNAKYIFDNKIGIDSEILITKGGDIIPDIVKVITPSEVFKYPQEEYEWKGVDLVLVNKNSDDIKIQKIVHFFSILNIKDVGKAMIEKLYERGYKEIYQYFDIPLSIFNDIPGLGEKSGKKLIDGLSYAMNNTDYPTLMAASGIFDKNLSINRFTEFVNGVDDWTSASYNDILKIKGFGEILAKNIDDNLDEFLDFIEDNIEFINIKENKYDNDNMDLIGQSFVFSGIRDDKLEKEIKRRGGEIHTTVKKNTNNIIVKNKNDKSSKIQKALEKGINIIQYDEW